MNQWMIWGTPILGNLQKCPNQIIGYSLNFIELILSCFICWLRYCRIEFWRCKYHRFFSARPCHFNMQRILKADCKWLQAVLEGCKWVSCEPVTDKVRTQPDLDVIPSTKNLRSHDSKIFWYFVVFEALWFIFIFFRVWLSDSSAYWASKFCVSN
jgi:hypothetical protein